MKSVSCILSKFYIKPQPTEATYVMVDCCILSKFYIKPQRRTRSFQPRPSCILSKFYIKPQHTSDRSRLPDVVSYRNSTSNHNSGIILPIVNSVVSYRNSTSNHNQARRNWKYKKLYLIEILHQTTTKGPPCIRSHSCILSKFYIKPQLSRRCWCRWFCCILSKFYIKPQRRASY